MLLSFLHTLLAGLHARDCAHQVLLVDVSLHAALQAHLADRFLWVFNLERSVVLCKLQCVGNSLNAF
jgi:hypothetical protein